MKTEKTEEITNTKIESKPRSRKVHTEDSDETFPQEIESSRQSSQFISMPVSIIIGAVIISISILISGGGN